MLTIMSLLAMLASSTQGTQADRKVDLIIRGAHVVTLAQPAAAEALAIRGDQIVAIGTNQQADQWFTEGTVVLDAEGGLVIPGFIDSHAHMMSLGASKSQLELTGTRSSDEIAAMVSRVASARPAGRWILGRGWDQNDWANKEFPGSDALARVALDHAVALTRVDGHALWVNRKAMELAQVLEQKDAPAGGEIVRDAAGQPTGVFVDAAMELITRAIPPPTADELREHLRVATEECLRNGVTSLHDAGASLDAIAVYKEAAQKGELGVRLYVMGSADSATLNELCKAPPVIGLGNNFLTIRSIKVYADGALGSRGAALLEDYADRPGHRGLVITTRPQIEQIMTRAIGLGFQVCVHAIGDRANRDVLDAFEKVLANRGNTPGAPLRAFASSMRRSWTRATFHASASSA
ncbi:MAG: amidohydrolase [Planctomycetota bacterium]